MTKKKKRVLYARKLRKLTRMTLPESVRVAKWYLRYDFSEPPTGVVERYVDVCGMGCCWSHRHYVTGRSGKPIWIEECFD